MYKRIPAIFIGTCCWLFASAQNSIDITHYRFELELNDQNDTLKGKAIIDFLPTYNIAVFSLDLTSLQANGKGMKIRSIAFTDPKLPKPAFAQQAEKVIITPANPLPGNTAVGISVEYGGIPADGLIISRNKYGKRTFFADNWPNRGHHWLPCNDDPADKASVEFVITAPQHYQVVANGIQLEETNLPGDKKKTHWKEEVPLSTKVMVIGVADFAVNLSGTVNNCIPVYSWVYPEDRNKGFYDYALANEILPWFIENVGPYAYKKLANVQSKTIFGGLENANTIFYSEGSVTGDRSHESLYVHEIAHQWFGNMATEKTFAHLWLSEGFASYFTILYMEYKYGKQRAAELLQEERQVALDFSNGKPVVNDTKNYMELLNPNSYQKGSWVLHMLRQELGDSVFWKSIRNYYAAYAGKTAATEDFQKVVEETSGKQLGAFFRQWLYTTENPRVRISWKYDAVAKQVRATVEQLQKESVFHLPLQVEMSFSNGKKITHFMNLQKAVQEYSWPAGEKPLQFKADPHTLLLFDGVVTELK